MAVINGSDNSEQLSGSETADTINGLGGSDVIDAGAGNDSVLGGLDNDTLYGGLGVDVLRGGSGDDWLGSETPDNEAGPNSGGDSLFGDDGFDFLSYRGSKAGYLDGGIDGDTLYLNGGNQSTMLGGGGNDYLAIEAILERVLVNAGDGNDTINSRRHVQYNATINGGGGDDILYFEGVDSSVYGGDGNDFIALKGNQNQVDAGAGNDLVHMYDSGADGISRFHRVSLGVGNDTITPSYYSVMFGGVTPVVTDFAAGAGGDLIDLSDVLGHLYREGMAEGTNPFTAGKLRLTDAGSATLLELRDSYGAENTYIGLLRLENIANPASLTAANFVQAYTPVVSNNAAAPVADAHKVMTVLEGGSANLGLGAPSDPDGGNIKIIVKQVPWSEKGSITLADGSWVSEEMELTSSQLSGLQIHLTPDNTFDQEGLQFKYQVIDEEGSVTTSFVQFRVTPVNDAPVIQAAQRTYLDGATSTYALVNLVSDVDTPIDQLKVSVHMADGSAAPAWVSINSSGELQLTPPEYTENELQLRLTVTDINNASVSQILYFTAAGKTINGTNAGDSLKGHTGNDIIYANGGADLVYGKAGSDEIEAGAGADTIWAGSGDDRISNYDGETSSNDKLYGEGGNDTLYDGTGNSTLDGGSGNDEMWGNLGSDVYIVDSTADVVNEHYDDPGQRDRVQSSVSFAAVGPAGYVEDIVLTGTDNTYAQGNQLHNRLTGNSGHNTLGGGEGNDTLNGGLGNDEYFVDRLGDVVIELAGQGNDTVVSDIDWSLDGTQVENIRLNGYSDTRATGNSGANVLQGNSGNNVLDGAGGSDTLIGGLGNDMYYVDVSSDSIIEDMDQGLDQVFSRISWQLGANLEQLILLGSSHLNGYGNTAHNQMLGNSGNNVLDGKSGNDSLLGDAGHDSLLGGSGNDTLKGGAGNDVYVVDSGDTVVEYANAGTDLIATAVSRTLGSNIEHLYMQGSSAITGTGNDLNNWLNGNGANNRLSGLGGDDSLIGGAGNDSLFGGSGSDTLRGGLGNDLYSVDALTDVISEAAGEGTDSVQSSISYTLGSTLEHLTLTGSSALDGTGNSAANRLLGNGAANRLTGGAGNDTLDGGAGNDSLYGGSGNDRYQFGRGDGADRISENDTVSGNSDIAAFDAGISTSQLWLRRVGNDLELSIIGTSDRLTVGGWYLGSAYRVEKFQTADGQVLQAADVAKLVNAMASLTPPAAGQTTLPAAYQTELNAVIAANWN